MITKLRQPVRGPRRSGQRGAGRHAGQRSLALRRASGDGLSEERGHRQADGPDRLRHLLAGRAPLPARGLRVHPERPDAGPAPLPPHEEHQVRLRLQHRADVAPAADGRGLRHRRLPDQRPGRLRRRARLPHPRGRGLRRADARPGRQPRAVRGAGRASSSRRSTSAPSPTRASTTRSRRAVPYRGYELKEITLVPRPKTLPVECWQPIVSASPRGARLHGQARHQGHHRRRRGARRRQREGRPRLPRGARPRRTRDRAGRRPLHRLLVPHRRQRRAGHQGGDAVLRGEHQDVRAARLRARPHPRADRGGRRPEAGPSGQPADPRATRSRPARG